jgi:hypothetical protein
MRQCFAGVITAAFLIMATTFSYCASATLDIDELVDRYGAATGVQRPKIEGANRYKVIAAIAVIKDVLDWNTFDKASSRPGRYYKVVTEQQATKAGTLYRVIIYYKDEAKVKNLVKGQRINIDGTFVKINDDIGSFSVWVFADKLTAEDKVMLEL